MIGARAYKPAIAPNLQHWSLSLQEYCQDLRKNSLSPSEWQEKIELLYQDIDLPELLGFIDFKRLTHEFKYPDLGVNTRMVKFPSLSGLPERTAYVKKVFGMKKDRAIIPHGHSNMASAHLVLKGEMQLRHYDRIREEKNHMIVRPTIDKSVGPGDASSISDERDNVHWFVANSEAAFTFDVIMLDLGGKSYDIHNLDMYEKEAVGNGLFRVPKLDVDTALNKYGKIHH